MISKKHTQLEKVINYNGELIKEKDFSLKLTNRAFRFGDSIFETIRVFEGRAIFLDMHIVRLFSSLSVAKMKLPSFFTGEYLRLLIKELIKNNTPNSGNARIRLTIFRKTDKNIYFVNTNKPADFIVEYFPLTDSNFENNKKTFLEIDIFEDIKKTTGILSQIKTNNVILHSIAGSLAFEKKVGNIILINNKNNIVEAVNSNIFIIKGYNIFTPKLEDGCVDGIFRKALIEIIEQDTHFRLEEKEINKKELLYCDEVFLTNSILGIQTVNKYRNKIYKTNVGIELLKIINAKYELNKI